jgi:cell division septal protein FtsQ
MTEKHIIDIIHTLTERISLIDNSYVQSRYETEGFVSYFMDEKIGVNLPAETVWNYKEPIFQEIKNDYLEANQYYYHLKYIQSTIRCIDAIFYFMNLNIKRNNYDFSQIL